MINDQMNETPAAPHADWALSEIERRRRAAYADPLTGSDIHFAEASRLSAIGDSDGSEAAKQIGIARHREIQSAHPYPVE